MISATVALLLALTGCSGNGDLARTTLASTEAASTTTPASTANETLSETPSPTPSAPAVASPDPVDYPRMDQQTDGGAKQAIRYFVATMIYAYQTGDTGSMDSMSTPDCDYCGEVRQIVENLRESGMYWGPTQIINIRLLIPETTDIGAIIGYEYSVAEHSENIGNPSASLEPPAGYVTIAEM